MAHKLRAFRLTHRATFTNGVRRLRHRVQSHLMTSETSPTAAATPSARGSASAPGATPSAAEQMPRQFGKYTLLRKLASGGMAEVFLAIQRAVAGFEKLVVVKRILPELSRNTAFVEMLLAEARTAATLNHPNVVQTFDVGEFEHTYFIAMEHIHGEDIRSVVRGMRDKGIAEFPLEHALTIVSGVCAGLGYAHEKRGLGGEPLEIVHRDISPQNILITFSGDVKVVDFGIAKSTAAVEVERTSAGQIKGKVPYMSPEQARGMDIDHRSDIFALGILLFELTTGRRLFKAKSDLETLKLICDRDYPRPSQVKPGYSLQLEAIVMRALEKDRSKRYQRARDMQADLEVLVRKEQIAASTVDLGNWMSFLFEEKIAQQKAVLQDAKQLADMIATQHIETNTEWMMSTTMGATAVTGAHMEAVGFTQRRQRRHWAMLAGVSALMLGGGTMFLLRAKKQAAEAEAAARAAATTAVEPEQKRGKVTITSRPDGAYVRIAGELQGQKTPLSLDKLPLHMAIELKISKEGFEDHVATVKLAEDKPEATVDVKLVKGTVTLVLDVEPRGATLMLDEKSWPLPAGGWTGQNKIEELSAGDHKALLSSPGYVPELVKFTTKKGDTKTLELRLKKADPTALAKKDDPSGAGTAVVATPPPASGGRGTVNVASSGGYCAQTIVNGKSVGPTPVAGISVAAGPVSVVCKTADGNTYGGGGQVKDGETARIRVVIPK
ncbi:MAG: PEGA domain-containing protein [Myxococcales bacterium]|nr:PEGA domain-containing protein [Myxococcales bacterium]